MNPYNYNYNYQYPANTGLYENQMNRLNNMQGLHMQQAQPPQQQQQQVGVIPVAGIEEVKAHAVDWSGNVSYFIDNANKCIYTKQLGLNGVPTVQRYILAEIEEKKNEEYATKDEVEKLRGIINDLLNKLGGVENEQ